MRNDKATIELAPARTPRHLLMAFGIMVVIGVVAPFLIYPLFAAKVLCFALFACAFNLLIGYTGMLSFGHAAFFGFAAYVTGHGAKVWGLPPELAILAGTAAAVLGLAFGILAIRRQGIYFAMITLALAQMLFFFCLQAPFTGGEDSIQAIPRGMMFGVLDLENSRTLYFVVLGISRRRLPADLPHRPLAVRTGVEGDPRKRNARHLPRLQGRSVQADRLRPLRSPVGTCGQHQVDRLPARLR